MISDKLKGIIIIGFLLSIVGIILLFFGVNFGTSLADNWLAKQGGADTSYYHIITRGYINTFLAAGSIFLGVGLITILIFYFKILKDKE
ncbi:hypothetical protein OPHB3_3000 [Oceanobacillus picturae]|uniref:Uncharacterized protein n=1 Tax=Oceanobacillus picturae TaxID=171693 RepID=A0A0U9HCP7_9BACI|nr:hypothetical protein [Oceanobacillus picturae]GAQ19041.1 hypothetical protein OPHB3_3000 [Oceanobacillus picturae]